MRIIKVKACISCPYFIEYIEKKWWKPWKKVFKQDCMWCGIGFYGEDITGIPDWCPLEDHGEEEKEEQEREDEDCI